MPHGAYAPGRKRGAPPRRPQPPETGGRIFEGRQPRRDASANAPGRRGPTPKKAGWRATRPCSGWPAGGKKPSTDPRCPPGSEQRRPPSVHFRRRRHFFTGLRSVRRLSLAAAFWCKAVVVHDVPFVGGVGHLAHIVVHAGCEGQAAVRHGGEFAVTADHPCPTGVGAVCASERLVPTVPVPGSSSSATDCQQAFSISAATAGGGQHRQFAAAPAPWAVFSVVTRSAACPFDPRFQHLSSLFSVFCCLLL